MSDPGGLPQSVTQYDPVKNRVALFKEGKTCSHHRSDSLEKGCQTSVKVTLILPCVAFE